MLDIKKTLAKILNWEGLKYIWDINTNNTTDTWVPVMRNQNIQHRVIPAMLGTRVTPTVQLANSNVMTITGASVECVQLNATQYLCVFTVRLHTTQSRTNLAACRFLINGNVLKPLGVFNFPAKLGSSYRGGWWDGNWFSFSGTWNANEAGEMYGSFIGTVGG